MDLHHRQIHQIEPMINTTDKLVILAKDAKLHRAVSHAIDKAIKLFAGQVSSNASMTGYARGAFAGLLGSNARDKSVEFDSQFLSAAMQFANSISHGNDMGDCVKTIQHYSKATPLAGTGYAPAKRAMKLMLVELWSKRIILLPTVFTLGTHFPFELFEHELLGWVQNVEPDLGSEGNGRARDRKRRLYAYGARLVLAADWRRPEDVSLEEMASLHRQQIQYQRGASTTVIGGGNQLPFSLFCTLLLRTFPERVKYTTDDLQKYSLWALTSDTGKTSLLDFWAMYSAQSTAKSSRETSLGGRSAPSARRVPLMHRLRSLAQAEGCNHEMAVKAFQELQRSPRPDLDWRADTLPIYPGREHVDMSKIAPAWIESFKAFLHHRKFVKEYRTDHETMSCLNLLADYLFFYLPWWKELYPRSHVELPSSPRLFSRYGFVVRHTGAPIEELPLPLLDAIGIRRPSKDSSSIAVHQLTHYFNFLETNFADNDKIAGPGFRSPINDDFDAPRIKKKNKTNKIVIPKHIYGHLLFFCYAVETFGVHLQQVIMRGDLPKERGALRNALRFKCSEFGHSPSFKYRGQEFHLTSVPNAFHWVEREFVDKSTGETKSAYIPHCTTLRLLIASLETGLRAQSIQWLDRSTWDSQNVNAAADSYTFALYVNTDKVRLEPWTTYIVYRVRELLQREQVFQETFVDANRFGPVNYEGLDDSPFDPIRPLFRKPDSGTPIDDTTYSRVWQWLMVDFEAFYRDKTGERHVQMFRLRPLLQADGTPVIKYLGKAEDIPYCPISLLAVHTPHACRATFATHRQGILELSDVAEFLGHQNEVVTAHYTKPSGEELQARLHASDACMVSDYLMFEESSDGFVRADQTDSALVRSFSADRQATLRRFKFMPPLLLWSTKETSGENAALKHLQESPMSRIRFRDTHVCPVGEECPNDVIEQIGQPKRCGICPLAMKCVDHLPAIAAKRNQLMERIRYLHRRFELLKKAGEPTAALDEIWDELELDINEWLGWKLSEEILTTMQRESEENGTEDNMWHVERPEFVKRHLEKVMRTCDVTEFFLRRIADSNAYPTLSTPQVQAAAGRLKRKLLAGQDVDIIDSLTDDFESVRDTARMLSTMMKATGLTMPQVAAQLNAPARAPVETILLAGAGSGT